MSLIWRIRLLSRPRRSRPRSLLAYCGVLLFALFASSHVAPRALVFNYEVAVPPHSIDSYTEGLSHLDGMFYEGAVLNDQSALLVIDPTAGRIGQSVKRAPQYFGRGVVDWGPDVRQWIWKSRVCCFYDRFSLSLIKTFSCSGEDCNSRTSQEIRKITLRHSDRKIDRPNELEFIEGEIYASISYSDLIAETSPVDGHGIPWIDLTGLLVASERLSPETVLHGIAYDARGDLCDRQAMAGCLPSSNHATLVRHLNPMGGPDIVSQKAG